MHTVIIIFFFYFFFFPMGSSFGRLSYFYTRSWHMQRNPLPAFRINISLSFSSPECQFLIPPNNIYYDFLITQVRPRGFGDWLCTQANSKTTNFIDPTFLFTFSNWLVCCSTARRCKQIHTTEVFGESHILYGNLNCWRHCDLL